MSTLKITLLFALLTCSFGTMYAQSCTGTGMAVMDVCTFTFDPDDGDGDPNTTTYSYTVPATVSALTLEAYGGGGGGGINNSAEGGGGGGAYVTNTYVVSGGQNIDVVVGRGGGPGESGFASSYRLAFGSTPTAGGGTRGSGAAGGAGGTATPATGSVSASGGAGASGSGNQGGGGGGSGALATSASGGTGGTPGGGNGGPGGTNGQNGTAPGGGAGGGGNSGGSAGSGANGSVVLTITSILPVSLLSYTGEAAKTGVDLNWVTEDETDNEFFTVERSRDGRVFTEAARVSGRGTTTSASEYSWTDTAPRTGTNFYRLSQTDFDGTHAVLGVVSVHWSGRRVNVTPNPVTAGSSILLDLDGESVGGRAELISFDGRRVVGIQLDGAEGRRAQLPLDLPKGVYLLRLPGTPEVEPTKLIIE